MSDWVPAGSVAYDVACADGDYSTIGGPSGTVAYFSTVAYKPPKGHDRDPRMCRGAENTCKGWKSAGTDHCAGHRKAMVKEAEGIGVMRLMGLVA